MGSPSLVDADFVPTYDYSEWPLFVVRMPPRALSHEAFQRHLDACYEPYRRNQPFGMLIDVGVHPPPPAVQRRAISDAMQAADIRNPGMVRAQAIVVGSAFERGIVTAINWFARPPYPVKVFDSMPEAKTWLMQQLRVAR